MSSKKIVKKDEKKILEARGKFPTELLKWVTSPETEITQEVDRFLDRVMRDRRRRLEVFLTSLASKYVERAVFFVGQMPAVEAELLDPERIHTMKNSDLIRLLGLMSNHVDSAADFLRNFVSDDDLKREHHGGGPEIEAPVEAPDGVSDEDREAVEELSVESRQRIGSVLSKVLGVMEKVSPSKVQILPAPPAEDAAKKKSTKKKSTKKKSTKKSKGGK